MALRLGMSATPIHERIKRMEKDGVITGYRAMINPAKLGKTLTVFCDISLKEHAAEYLNQFEKDVMNLKEVAECYCVSGHSDFLLKIVVTDMDEYRDFILHKLASIKNIGNAQSHFVMNEMAIRLLERKYLLNAKDRNTLMKEIDDLISREDN